MIAIPEDFVRTRVRISGAVGRQWIDGLPTLLENLCAQWSLVPDGVPMHGHLGLVVPVKRPDGHLCVLKVSWIDESNKHEVDALAAWQGNGAIRLLASEPAVGAMLLERLDSRRSLKDVELTEAVAVAGRLLRRLAVPAPKGLPLLRHVMPRLSDTLADRWERCGRPMPRRWVDEAAALAGQLGLSRRGPARQLRSAL